MPAQPGYRAYFGTSNNSPDGVDVLPTGKIDILDTYTTWPKAYRTGTHTVNDDLSWDSPAGASCGKVDLSAAFHEYTARIDDGTITFLFDDVPCGQVATKADGAGKPYGFTPDVIRTNWMILSLAVSGGQQKPPTVPATMLVDRIEERWFSTCPPSCCPTRPGSEC